jgi:periplasmic protein TonB
MSDCMIVGGMAKPVPWPSVMPERSDLSTSGKLLLLALALVLHLLLVLGWQAQKSVALSTLAAVPLSVSLNTSSTPLRDSHPRDSHPRTQLAHPRPSHLQAEPRPPKPSVARAVRKPVSLLASKAGRRPVAPVSQVALRSAPLRVATAPSVVPSASPSKNTRTAPSAATSAQSHSGGAPVVLRQEAQFDAAYLHNPRPIYPPFSLRLREEGRVVLRVLVSRVGTAQTVSIAQSSGHLRLDRSAQETVKHWRFVPAQLGHDSMDSWVLVPINFSLRGDV